MQADWERRRVDRNARCRWGICHEIHHCVYSTRVAANCSVSVAFVFPNHGVGPSSRSANPRRDHFLLSTTKIYPGCHIYGHVCAFLLPRFAEGLVFLPVLCVVGLAAVQYHTTSGAPQQGPSGLDSLVQALGTHFQRSHLILEEEPVYYCVSQSSREYTPGCMKRGNEVSADSAPCVRVSRSCNGH